MTPDLNSAGLGVYLHVPFCHHICHYCDFAKTARYTETQVQQYFAAIAAQLRVAIGCLPPGALIDTVFVGGGTPSLFTTGYEPWFAAIRPRLAPQAEITIEVNPLHATQANCSVWRQLGFNRISLGVQSYADEELAVLTRQHRRQQAIAATTVAREAFTNVSVDLIYGQPKAEAGTWQESIATAIGLGVDHLSMYTLTYEGNTVFNRRKKRQLMAEHPDDVLERQYLEAMAIAGSKGFDHYEVSNWAKPGFASRHNQKYWQMADYLALGTGAHGFLASQEGAGKRYSFSRKIGGLQQPAGALVAEGDLVAALTAMGAEFEEERSEDDYLSEAVLSSLRTARGVPIRALERRLGRRFLAGPVLAEGVATGLVGWQGESLCFSPKEWFREYGWVHQVLAGFD